METVILVSKLFGALVFMGYIGIALVALLREDAEWYATHPSKTPSPPRRTEPHHIVTTLAVK